MTYEFSKIWEELEEEFNFEFLGDRVDDVEDSVKNIVELINRDLEIEVAGPFSHNIIGLSLSTIEGKSSREVALRVMDLVPAIEFAYKISRPENDI